MTETNTHVSGVATQTDGNPRRWLPVLGVLGFLIGAVQGMEVAFSTYPGVLTESLSHMHLEVLLELMSPLLLLAAGYVWATDVTVASEYQPAVVAVTAAHLIGFGLAVSPRFLAPESAAYGWAHGMIGFGIVEVLPILATPFVLLGGASVASFRGRASEQSSRGATASEFSVWWAIAFGVAGFLAGIGRWKFSGFGLVYLLDTPLTPELMETLVLTAYPLGFVLNWILLFLLGYVWGGKRLPGASWLPVFGIVLVTAVFGYISLYLTQILVIWPDIHSLVRLDSLVYVSIQSVSFVVAPCVVLAGAMVARFGADPSR